MLATGTSCSGEAFVVERRSDRAVIGAGALPAAAAEPRCAHSSNWRCGSARPTGDSGYGTEAAQALIDRAFAHTGISEVCAAIRVVNVRGRRLIEKCGFQPRGTGMARLSLSSGAYPVERFVLSRRAWVSLKAWGAPVPEEQRFTARARPQPDKHRAAPGDFARLGTSWRQRFRPVIATARLVLRPLRTDADANDFAAMIDVTSAVARMLARVPQPYTRANALGFIDFANRSAAAGRALISAITLNGRLIGVASIDAMLPIAATAWATATPAAACSAPRLRHRSGRGASGVCFRPARCPPRPRRRLRR